MPKIVLLCADLPDLDCWVVSLKKQMEMDYDLIDITCPNWMEKCLAKDYSLYLARSPGITNLMKQIFDERMQILSEVLEKPIYPSLTEIRLHENKKYLAAWLKARDLPHPETSVILSKKEAYDFLRTARYPLVAKQNIGSSGKGVRILNDGNEAGKIIDRAFRKGIRPRIGPNLRTASLIRKFKNVYRGKGLLSKRLSYYKAVYKEPQKFLIMQEYIPHDFEWRAVVIGESYFAHKKMVSGKMASGSLAKNYDDPPLALLDFIRNLSINHGITSASIDLFDTGSAYLINEIQTYFGQSDPYQMKVGGIPGRYRFLEGEWVFEPGDWASNQCYDLRLEHAMALLSSKSRTEAT